MHISTKADHAVRALLVLADAPDERPISGAVIAATQSLPAKYTENILVDLRRSGLVASHRGASGGFRLARPATDITIADVIRATDGPLAEVRGERPEEVSYDGVAEHLQDVWVAVRTSIRRVLEEVTLAHVLSGKLPSSVRRLAAEPESWSTRSTRPGVSAPPSSGPPQRLRKS